MHESPTPMRIGIIGATGGVGTHIANEAASRGHHVTVLPGEPEGVAPSAPSSRRDVLNLRSEDVEGLDVLVNAHRVQPGRERDHIEVNRHLISLLTGTPVRLIVVGSAGHLYTDSSRTAIYWQSRMKRGTLRNLARTFERAYFLYKISRDLRWTYLAPPIEFDSEGERTGRYRAGDDVILTDERGRSRLSHADYAVALVDEIETSSHPQRMYTVAQA